MQYQPATTQQRHYSGLDNLRAFAILYVFLFHYGRIFPSPQWVTGISKFGWTGVDLFFVLSGFLIASQLFKNIADNQNISLKAFYVKRFFRIIPAYIVVVAIYFLLPSFREREAPAPLWKYLSFTQNLGLNLRTQGTFSHAWSLCIEEQFYLFFPLVLIAFIYTKALKKARILIALLFIAGFFIRAYGWHLLQPYAQQDSFAVMWYKYVYYPTYCRLDGLLTGIAIAAALQFMPRLTARLQARGNYFLPAGITVLITAYFICINERTFTASVFGFPLVSLGYGCIVLSAVLPTGILSKLRSNSIETIAGLSYSIYLVHKITIHITQVQFAKWGIAEDGNVMFIICMATTVAAAYILHTMVERPILRLRHRFLHEGCHLPKAK